MGQNRVKIVATNLKIDHPEIIDVENRSILDTTPEPGNQPGGGSPLL